jgi:pheromone shutdown protein TraB
VCVTFSSSILVKVVTELSSSMSNAGDADVPEPPDPSSEGRGSVDVLGTAHVSQASVDEVHETVDEADPDIVAVELDENRYRQMQGGAPDDIEAKDLLSGNTVFQFLAYWMLSYVQSRLGDRFDIEPGADMRAAIEAAERNGSGVALVDRDIQITIQRFWRRLSFTEKLKMVGGLALGVTDPRTIGLTFGATIGLAVGLVFAAFLAPVFGLGELLALGITAPATLQYVGAGGVGIVGGLLLGLIFLPSIESANRYTGGLVDGFTTRLLSGAVIGLVGCLALVATGTSVGPLSAGAFESAGGYVLRGTVGALAGLGVGVAVGAALGIVLEAAGGDVEEIDEIDIEEMTDGDVVAAMMEEFRRFSPRGANALIDERDAYIAHKLHGLRERGYYVVAVVGAGHKAGIERYLRNPSELPPMETLTGTASGRRFSPLKIVGYLATFAFVAFFFLLIMAGVQNTFLLQLFLAWFLFNGVFAFTLARLAGARWTSAGVGGAVAWLTSINPLLAPGWFAGYVELRHRPVNVRDIQTLNEIIGDTERAMGDALEDMFDVPLFRLIMIVALTNIGSMIATFLFFIVVIPWMAPEIGGVDALMNELFRGAQNSLDLIRGVVT